MKLNWKQPCAVLGQFWTAGYFTGDGGYQTGEGLNKEEVPAHFSKDKEEVPITFWGWSFPTAQDGGNQHFPGTLESRAIPPLNAAINISALITAI